MENLKRKVDRHRRQLDDLILEIAAKRQLAIDEFDFKAAGQLEKAMEFIQNGNNTIYMATIALT